MPPNDENLPVPLEPSPLVLIREAIAAKLPMGELKELFEMQVRAEQFRAEAAYADAITAFQAWCPQIQNSKAVKTKSGGEAYRYAPLEEIMRIITPGLRANRIVISFDTSTGEGQMQVTARVRVGVVEKHTTVVLPVPQANAMTNATQATVGAVSYGKRCALMAALNIVCTDEDQSGNVEGDPIIGQNEVDDYQDAFEKLHSLRRTDETARKESWNRVLVTLKVKGIWELRQSQWRMLMDQMGRAIKKETK